MNRIFLTVFKMSISAAWVVLAVILLRIFLKKAPKWVNALLWGIVAVRLICPFAPQSEISLIPSVETISPEIITDSTTNIDTGVYFPNGTLVPSIGDGIAPEPTDNTKPIQSWASVLSVVWISGAVIMISYSAISVIRLKNKLSDAIQIEDNLFESARIASPFVFGLINPKIYLPHGIKKEDIESVVAHEKAHIKRLDHFWKPLGFLLLSLHWFNPFIWLAYILLCRDIEAACDEKVVKKLDVQAKADYSQALLNCSVNRRTIAACPIAFGETGVKKRVKNVLNYKKPSFWIIILALIACITAAVCLLTNPLQEDSSDASDEYSSEDASNTSSLSEIGGVDSPIYITVVPTEQIEALKDKYPQFFDLDTSKGLDVIIGVFSSKHYICGILPGSDTPRTSLSSEVISSQRASIDDIRIIVSYYLMNGLVSRDKVEVYPVEVLYSSVFFDSTPENIKKIQEEFWNEFPILENSQYDPIIDTAEFDIDCDGEIERCVISYGPTSGLFTFRLIVYSANAWEGIKYNNIYYSEFGQLKFVDTDAGTKLKLSPVSEKEPTYYSFTVDDGNILLVSEDNE